MRHNFFWKWNCDIFLLDGRSTSRKNSNKKGKFKTHKICLRKTLIHNSSALKPQIHIHLSSSFPLFVAHTHDRRWPTKRPPLIKLSTPLLRSSVNGVLLIPIVTTVIDRVSHSLIILFFCLTQCFNETTLNCLAINANNIFPPSLSSLRFSRKNNNSWLFVLR